MTISHLDAYEVEGARVEARRLESFLSSLASLRQCKFCYIVAQVVVSTIERWSGRNDEKLGRLLGTSMGELSELLQKAESKEVRK